MRGSVYATPIWRRRDSTSVRLCSVMPASWESSASNVARGMYYTIEPCIIGTVVLSSVHCFKSCTNTIMRKPRSSSHRAKSGSDELISVTMVFISSGLRVRAAPISSAGMRRCTRYLISVLVDTSLTAGAYVYPKCNALITPFMNAASITSVCAGISAAAFVASSTYVAPYTLSVHVCTLPRI